MILKKRYPRLSFAENFLGGHITVGNVTVFGANGMHWGVTIRTRWGYICFRLPFRCFGRWWPLYFYLSPNATPQNATFYVGNEVDEVSKVMVHIRRVLFGHNFGTSDEFADWNRRLRDELEHLYYLNRKPGA